jgi:chromate transporter
LGFLEVALCSFGGAFAWAFRILVQRRRWLSEDDFAKALAICQVLPGPNIVNLSVFLGYRFFGVRGAVVAVAGLTLLPIAIVIGLESLYLAYSHLEPVSGMLRAMGAAAAGLVLGTGFRLLRRLPRRVTYYALAVVAFTAIGVMRWPLAPVVLSLVALALLLAIFRKL